jgi:hypothetical protein
VGADSPSQPFACENRWACPPASAPAGRPPPNAGVPPSVAPGGEVEPGAGLLVRRLRARQPQVVDAILARVRAAVPDPVGERDQQYALGLREAVAGAVEYGLAGIECGGLRPAAPPAAAVLQAQRAARSGVTLDRVLLRYSAGGALLGDFIVEEAERSGLLGRRGALRGVLHLQTALLEQLTAAIVREYEHECQLAARSPAYRRAALIERLLGGAPAETAKLDYRIEAWHLAVIATGARAESALSTARGALGCELLSVERGEGTVWAWLGAAWPLDAAALERALCAERSAPACGVEPSVPVATAPPSEGLAAVDASFAIGECAWGVEGWRSTHRQAQDALGVALRAPRAVTRFTDVALLAPWLADPVRARTLVETYLAPLRDGRDVHGALRATLRTYFACEQNVNATAAALGVNRGTVRRRIGVVEELLGSPLYRRRAELEVAMRLEELGCAAG